MPNTGRPIVIGLDLNATRARAAVGAVETQPRALPLEGQSDELPLALSLENRHIEIGSPGLAICRRLPHLACFEFLASLGTDQQWSAGRHRLDASRALSVVFDHIRPTLSGPH